MEIKKWDDFPQKEEEKQHNPISGEGMFEKGTPLGDLFYNNGLMTFTSDNDQMKIVVTTDTLLSNIPTGSIGELKIADNAITTNKIADNAVTSAKIPNAGVPNAKLASDRPHFAGNIQGNLPAGLKTIDQWSSIGFTLGNSSRTLTCTIAGKYFINARQLINAGAGTLYWGIMKNSTFISYGYKLANTFSDANCSIITDLNVGDYIEIYQTQAISGAWGSPHSSLEIFKL